MNPRCAALSLLIAAAACEREARRFRPPPGSALPALARVGPGASPPLTREEVHDAYEGNAWAVSEGKRLYEQWNCAGCHSARGGGGMGPALMDARWIYGSAPDSIFETIARGRPNGMPAFGARIGEDDAWKLVAYVRTLPALTPKSVRSGRSDDMSGTSPNPQSRREAPTQSRAPAEPRRRVAP